MDAAITNGVDYGPFQNLLLCLTTEALIAADHATLPEQWEVIQAYMELVQIYQDCATLWRNQIKMTAFEGSVIAPPDILALASKYDIKTSTGSHGIGRIPDDSVSVVLGKASIRSDAARSLYLNWKRARPR